MKMMRRSRWSPFAAGAAIGALEILSMLTVKRPLGITTPFEKIAALGARKIAPERMSGDDYESMQDKPLEIGWEEALVAGVALGGMLSGRLSGQSAPPAVPEIWRREVGPSRALRYFAAAAGGAVMMFGARMAKGCTSGHGISGTMQFAASSLVFTPVIFLTGGLTSRALFGRLR